MDTQLHDYLGRHKRYDNIDGTGEITFGLMALGFTFLDYVQTALPKDSMWRHGFPDMALFISIILLMLAAMHWGPKAIKKHITWPRTGYVVYRVGGKSFWLVIILTAIVSAVVASGLAYLTRSSTHPGAIHPAQVHDGGHDWMSITWMSTVAIYVAGYACFTYLWGRNYPWKWLVLLVMVLGLAAIVLIAPVTFAGLRRPMLLFVGLMWLASGAGTLYVYVRHTQLPAQGEE